MYLSKKPRKEPGSYSWHVTAPQELIDAKLARSQVFRDGRKARFAAKVLERKVKLFREGRLVGRDLPKNPTLRQVAAHYLQTEHFKTLSRSTQENYPRKFNQICDTPFRSGLFGEQRVRSLTSRISAEVYNQWLTDGTPVMANDKKRHFSVLMSHAIVNDLLTNNPMQKVKVVREKPNVQIWTSSQVTQFLDVAFQQFEYRSIGLVVLLCYEWGQRPVDITHLMWSSVDFESNTCKITQRKRGATVHLPIEGNVLEMLRKQHEDFGFQKCVCPVLGGDKVWKPMTSDISSRLMREVRNIAGLPHDLKLQGLRPTAVTEMLEAGLDSLSILPVSGHRSVASLNPYIRHTRQGAERALSVRRESKE